MPDLKRLIKKQTVVPLLARAESLLGPGWRTVLAAGKTILACSGDPPDAACMQSSRALVFKLVIDDESLGNMVLIAPDDAFSRSEIQRLGEFIAAAITELLNQEITRRSLAVETLEKYRELSLLHRATLSLNNSLRPRDVAQALLTECQTGRIPAGAGLVVLRRSPEEDFKPVLSYGPESQRLDGVIGSTLFLDIVRSQKGELINELASDTRWRGEVRRVKAMLVTPLVSSNQCVGALILGSFDAERFTASHLQYVSTLSSVAGIAMGNAINFENIQLLIKSLMQALATAIDARDPFTAGHSQRVAWLAVALSKVVHDDQRYFPGVSFDESDLHEILYAGLLHDVGKIGIREEVLTKSTRLPEGLMDVIGQRMALWGSFTGIPWTDDYASLQRINRSASISRDDAALIARVGEMQFSVEGKTLPILTDEEMSVLLIPRGNLTAEERREIERHPSESYRILQHIPFPENMKRLLTIISQHHERLDGSGYPGGLRSADILLQSRIIAIVDIYDAITQERHYKPALTRAEALGVLWKEAQAGKIDRNLVELLEACNDQVEHDAAKLALRKDFQEYLNNGQPRTESCG